MSVYGDPGSGKSEACIYFCFLFEKWLKDKYNTTFDLDHVSFSYVDTNKLLRKSNPGDIILTDEQVEMHGEGSRAELDALANIESIIRQEQICLLFASPEPRTHVHHFVLESTNLIDYERKLNYFILYHGLHTERPKGIVITRKPADDEFVREYQKKKAKFIRKAKRHGVKTIFQFWVENAEKIVKLAEEGKKFRSLADVETQLMLMVPNRSINEYRRMARIFQQICDEKGIDWRKKKGKK